MEWNLEEAMAYYARQGAPGDQGAVIALLKEVQREQGILTPEDLGRMAEFFDVKEGLFLALIRRIPGLRLGNRPVLELCAGPNCRKAAALAAFAEGLTGVTVKTVPCMRQCGKGPNIRLNGVLYHHAAPAMIQKLLEER